MNPWIFVWLFFAAIYFLIDLLVRRKRWKNNTRQEKLSMIIAVVCLPFYAFYSALGIFVGIVGAGDSAIEQFFYNATVFIGAITWIVSLAVIVASIILRRLGKAKASTMIHIPGMGLIAVQMIMMAISDYL